MLIILYLMAAFLLVAFGVWNIGALIGGVIFGLVYVIFTSWRA